MNGVLEMVVLWFETQGLGGVALHVHDHSGYIYTCY